MIEGPFTSAVVPIASGRCDAKFGRYLDIADSSELSARLYGFTA